jgi:hypothetical protein
MYKKRTFQQYLFNHIMGILWYGSVVVVIFSLQLSLLQVEIETMTSQDAVIYNYQ